MATLSPPPGFGASPQLLEQPQLEETKRPRDKRVTWAAGDNLCQVRLFVAEDPPAVPGTAQEQLQAKQVRNLHIFNSVTSVPAPDAPPGFGGVAIKPKPDLAALAAIEPQILWRPPSGIKLDPTWLVVAGGASKEIVSQNLREVRVLEAVYPRPSSIPDSPAEPLETQEPYDDEITPQIPLVPLEEEDLPDGNDIPSLALGNRFLSQGFSTQVAAVQMVLPKSSGLPNGRPEKVKHISGDYLPGPMQENLHARKESARRDPSTVFAGRSVMDRSDPSSSRSLSSGPLSDGQTTNHFHSNLNRNSAEPDVAAAAAAAFAALSKSKEMGSMIDNELLIQILSDPSLIHSLTSKPPFTHANSKSEFPSSLSSNGISRGHEKINQAQIVNGVTSVGNHWISPSSTYVSAPSGGQDGNRSKVGEVFSSGGERFQRTASADDRSSSFLLVPSGNSQQLYAKPTNGRVGSGVVPRTVTSSAAPPGFGDGNTNASSNSNIPPGFGNNSGSQQGSQQVGATPARPLSRLDEQYFKSLIMQHGCKSADDDDHGRAGIETQGSGVARSDGKRWYGREEVDGINSEKNGRERRDSEKNGIASAAVENGTRAKSRKACIYFGTARGCRNGDSCTFVHEASESGQTKTDRVRNGSTHLPYAKRLKVDG